MQRRKDAKKKEKKFLSVFSVPLCFNLFGCFTLFGCFSLSY